MRTALALAFLVSAGDRSFAAQAKRRLPRQHHPVIVHQKQTEGVYESYNWSGYAVTGSNGSVTDVKGSWVVPSVGSCSAAPHGYAAFWVGIDGFTSSTVEQIGTDSDCENLLATSGGTPTYYAWFEFYPQNAYLVGDYTADGVCESDCVHPGDIMSAEVIAGSGRTFTVNIRDITQNWFFTTSSSVPGAAQSSAEWIAETPFGCPTDSGFCPMSDFNVVDYGIHFTAVRNTCWATVSGKAAPLGDFGNNVQELLTVNYPSATTLMALPSALFGELTSFAVSWFNRSP